MERGVCRERWSQKAPIGILLLMSMFIPTLTLLQPTNEHKCPDGDYDAGNGICCNKCSPGFKLVDKCYASNQRSNCTPCPESQYMDQMNYFKNCRSCKECKGSKNEIEVSPCERHRNTVCQCKVGYYKHNIDSDTYECRKCTKCRSDEKEQEKCKPENNTVCQCKDGYYRVNYKCEPCKECGDDCKHLCPSNTRNPQADPEEKRFINIIGVTAAVALIMCVMFVAITHFVTKRSMKNQLKKSPSESSNESQDSCEKGLIYSEQHPNNSLEAIPQCSPSDPEPSNSPDCPRLGIKIPDLIYTVLDLVPVLQAKQLMRSLGVRDTDIEHAELDYKSSREAHYQILRIWAEGGSNVSGRGGKSGFLHEPLLKELLDKLREMNLGRAAEELETKYGIY